jgi:hypothetical protein
MQLSPQLPSLSSTSADNGQLQVRLYVRTGTRCAGTSNLLLQTPDPKTELPPAPTGNFLQLQEVRLFGDDGTRLPISSASNPMGDSPNAQPPGEVIDNDLGYLLLADCSPVCCTFTLPSCTAHNNKDGDCDCGDECHCSRGSKWLDFNIATAQNMDGRANYNSTLLLTLAAPAHVAAYELITADDAMQRDPSSWTFYGQYDDTWVPLKTEEVVPPETRYTSYSISYLPRFLPPPTPPAPPPRFASMLPPAPGSVRPAPPPPPPPPTQDPTPRQPLLSPPPSVPDGLDLDANSQPGPDQISALVYVLAGCLATLLCLGVCGFALFCWYVHNRQVRAAVQHRTAPHRTAPRRAAPRRAAPHRTTFYSVRPHFPVLQMRGMLQTYVEPASSERGSSAHLQLQKLEDVRMPSELWEAESNRSQQPAALLPVSPSGPTRAATSDTLQRAQGELSQHWLSLSSLHSDLSRSPRERHQEPHDDEPRQIAEPTTQQCKAASEAASGSANSVMQGEGGVSEAGVAGVGAVQPQVAVPSDQPTDTQRTFVRL